jgi:hypothetical protein
MTLHIELHHRACPLSPDQEERINRQFETLALRMEHFPEPLANLRLERHEMQRRVTADLILRMGPSGRELVSHQAAETPDRAALLAVQDVERQLERELSTMRGEHTYGVPSRRLPEDQRPNPPERTPKQR